MRFRWLYVLFMGTLAVPFATGCSGCNKRDPNTIVILSSLPRTGSAKGQTDTMVNGIQMAIDEYGGRVGDFPIVFLDKDDAEASSGQWTAAAETANANAAVNDKDVMVYIGPYNSGAAAVSMPILNKAGITMISPAATATGLTKKNPDNKDEPEIYRPTGKVNFCRVVPTDDKQGPVAARFIAEELKKKRVYILNDNERYGEGIAKEFEGGARAYGLTVMGNEKINVAQQEFGSLMTKIKNSDGGPPDAIYFGGTTQSKGGQIAKDMIKTIPNCVLLVPDGCYEKAFIDSAGINLEGKVFVTFGGRDPSVLTGPGKAFVDKYREKYKTEPEAYAVYGYEAAKVALAAIKKVNKKDRDAIREAILATKNFGEGAIGTWSFDENGDISAQIFTISKIEGSRFVPVKELDMAKEKAAP
jgi:branched-chain amino acid transport system substrate-binding protein